MKLIKILSLSIVLLVVSKTTAQEFKLGKVSVSELEQKVHPKDSTAPAAILYKKGKARIEYDQTEGNFITLTDVEVRIKVYKRKATNGQIRKYGILKHLD
ncbi:hypothetical protein RB619_12845 [Flavobacterium sp. LHD-80]|uniref:hypothetical protein n=1 Tax=Flavobacterium sp. LHD-80 TaxID=3071411 RepID=UPI0027E04B2D|nr:hypothetical protein [Flavobacterium sp. LHD-80]MDQ6471535.1 hypothetical protein [Flavobacterium sp. LHD-80]